MRYEDWDVLLFPADSRAPFKEFKAVCHVVKDPGTSPSGDHRSDQPFILPILFGPLCSLTEPPLEFSEAQGSYGLPTVCCFTPSHDGGAPFQVSVHSWQTPTISQVTRAYSKHPEDAKFEIRVFVDGRLTMYGNPRHIYPIWSRQVLADSTAGPRFSIASALGLV